MEQLKDYKAFVFDLNGTMIDDMEYHICAWYRILNNLGASISLARVKEECYGKNHELLDRIFPGRFSYAEKDQMSMQKEREYQKEFKPRLRLIEGLHAFLEKAHEKGKGLAVGSAAIPYNIDFVLDGCGIRHLIDVVVSAEDVEQSKPHPQTFLQCATALSLTPQQCLVFEDTPMGAEAAFNAGMDCIVITTLHQPEEFKQYSHIKGFIPDYKDATLYQLL